MFSQPPKIAKTYDDHILASQQIIGACKKALRETTKDENNIVVKGENGTVLFTRARSAIINLVNHHEDCVTILQKMRDNQRITSAEFEQVIQLHDVRRDIRCFTYGKVSFPPQP